jgi:hypothetical protein
VTGTRSPIGLGFGSLWVADLDAKAIDRVNPRTRPVVGRLPVGGFPVRLAVGLGSVRVRDDDRRVLRIKPQSSRAQFEPRARLTRRSLSPRAPTRGCGIRERCVLEG